MRLPSAKPLPRNRLMTLASSCDWGDFSRKSKLPTKAIQPVRLRWAAPPAQRSRSNLCVGLSDKFARNVALLQIDLDRGSRRNLCAIHLAD